MGTKITDLTSLVTDGPGAYGNPAAPPKKDTHAKSKPVNPKDDGTLSGWQPIEVGQSAYGDDH